MLKNHPRPLLTQSMQTTGLEFYSVAPYNSLFGPIESCCSDFKSQQDHYTSVQEVWSFPYRMALSKRKALNTRAPFTVLSTRKRVEACLLLKPPADCSSDSVKSTKLSSTIKKSERNKKKSY